MKGDKIRYCNVYILKLVKIVTCNPKKTFHINFTLISTNMHEFLHKASVHTR
jgi:hypothetical protein